MLEKIRYRLVYNRQNKLNRQGTALVQIEAYLNQRKVYFKTNVYLKPECWSKDGAYQQEIYLPYKSSYLCYSVGSPRRSDNHRPKTLGAYIGQDNRDIFRGV